MLIDSMLLTFCCSIILLRLFPVIDLPSFLIQLYRVFNDGLCVKLMKRFIRGNLIWRVCESGSIRNLCVSNGSASSSFSLRSSMSFLSHQLHHNIDPILVNL